MMEKMISNSCNIRAEISTNSMEKQTKCGKYSKIFNTKYCMNTKKQNIFSRNFLYGIPMNDIYILMSEKKQRDISRI